MLPCDIFRGRAAGMLWLRVEYSYQADRYLLILWQAQGCKGGKKRERLRPPVSKKDPTLAKVPQ